MSGANGAECAGICKDSLAQDAANHVNVVRRLPHDTSMRNAL